MRLADRARGSTLYSRSAARLRSTISPSRVSVRIASRLAAMIAPLSSSLRASASSALLVLGDVVEHRDHAVGRVLALAEQRLGVEDDPHHAVGLGHAEGDAVVAAGAQGDGGRPLLPGQHRPSGEDRLEARVGPASGSPPRASGMPVISIGARVGRRSRWPSWSETSTPSCIAPISRSASSSDIVGPSTPSNPGRRRRVESLRHEHSSRSG